MTHTGLKPAPTTTPRRGRPVALSPEARRERIFDAPEAVFLESGLDGASMEAIARRAGMSKPTVYGVFPGRQALIAEQLKLGVARGEIRVADTPAAAALLLDMMPPGRLDSLLDPALLPDADALAARRDLAIAVFPGGIGAA